MKKKEHFEVILEDINSKLDLVFENFQSLNHKIDQNKIDLDNRNDETNKLLKFAHNDLDKKIQGNGPKIEENTKLIKENRKLIEENGKKFETLGKKQHNYEERLVLLEKRCC